MDIPVVLITYKRPHHTQQVLEALRKFEIQNLFIYSDGPKNEIDLSGVYETRSLLYRIDWTNPIIIERENNIGLASSITSAANDVFKSHDKLILLEDDCVPQKHFFQFMETCLSRYEKDESVFGISGYTLPLPQNIQDSYPYDLYFSPRIGSWGWGTWKSAWDKQITNLENAFWDAIQRGVDLTQGGNDVPVMIRQFLSGQLKDVWTLNWLVTVYINKGYYIYPTFSHIKNIGMDGSGVHCGHTAKFNTIYGGKKATRFPEDIILDQTILNNFRIYYDVSSNGPLKGSAVKYPTIQTHTDLLSTQNYEENETNTCRILQVSDHQKKGGAAIAGHRLFSALKSAHANVKLITFNDPLVLENGCYSWDRVLSTNRGIYNSQTPMLVSTTKNDWVDLVSAALDVTNPLIINIHNIHEAIHYHSVPFDVLDAMASNARLVFTLHDMWLFTGRCAYTGNCERFIDHSCNETCPTHTVYPQARPNDISALLQVKKDFFKRNPEAIIVTPSQWLANQAKKSYLNSHRIVVIPYGIDTTVFRPDHDRENLRRSIGIPGNACVLLITAANLSDPRKGALLFLKALSKIKHDLIVLTVGRTNIQPELPKNIKFYNYGFVTSPEEMAFAYSVADIFICPSVEDNLPCVLIESISCGTPCIGFNVGGVPEVIRSGKTGWLAPEATSQSLSMLISDLIENPDKIYSLRPSCREVAKKEYALMIQAERYLKLYQQLIGQKAGIGYHASGRQKDRESHLEGRYKEIQKNIGKLKTKTNEIEQKKNGEDKPIVDSIKKISDTGTNKYFVSAIVSTYNAEKFIHGCLDNLENQTIADRLEIIVVNSGSTENEEAIVREFQQKYENIKYIRTNKRETVYAAWNRGIKAATGEYITNANTDDRHRKDAYEIMVKILEDNSDVALVYADVIITETENETFENFTPVGTFKWLEWNREDLLNIGCFMGPQPMWRKALHGEYGYFDKTLVTSGDYEYWLRISQTHNFFHLPVFLGLYLRSPYSIEHSNRKTQKIENNRILKMYKNALQKGKIIRKNMNYNNLKRSIRKISLESKEQRQIPETLYKEIISSIKVDMSEATIKKLEKLLQDFPDYALAQNDLGVLYSRQGHNELALARYKLAVVLEPGNTNFRKNLADLLTVAFAEYEEALQHYVAVLASDPKDVEALLATGHICARLERYDDAAEFYERVLEIEPNNSDAANWLAKMQDKRSASSLEGNLNDHYTKLLSDIDHDDLAEAILKIENFIEMYPKHGQAHNDLGVLYYKNESKAKVLPCYLKAVELEPENVTFRKNLADFLYVEEGRVEEALENYVEVLRIKPDDIETLLITGHICTAIERFEDAVSFYHKVLDAEPQNLDARKNLEALEKREISMLNQGAKSEEKMGDESEVNQGEPKASTDQVPIVQTGAVEELINKAYLFFQQERIDQAVDTFLKAIAVNPLDGRTYIELAGQLINHSRHENALEVLSEMPAKQPENLAKQKLLMEGYGQEGMGNYAAAKKCCDSVLAHTPEDAKALNLNGILTYRNGDKATAEQHFKRAIEMDSEYGEPHTNLGALVWETSESKKALGHYERGFTISPTDIDIANAYHEAIAATGEYERAEKAVLPSLKSYPHSRKIRYLLIDVLIKQGKTEKALGELEAAISILGIDEGLLDTTLALRKQVENIKNSGSSKKPNVSLCMIVKDEEANLAKCLSSVKPIVDEMVIVDTGSIDRTKGIAEFFGAHVFDFGWNGDFSAARNFSLSKAKGRWILIMDADEVVSSKDYGRFRKLVSRKTNGPAAYSIVTRNYCIKVNSLGWTKNDGTYSDEEAGSGWLPSEKVRLFRGDNEIRFEGAVHEMVDPVLKRMDIAIEKCFIPVHHYGSLNSQKLDSKGLIYYKIGRKKLAEKGNDMGAVRELAIQATILERNTEALELWQRLISMEPGDFEVAKAFINIGTINIRMKDYGGALAAAKKAVKFGPSLKESNYNLALAELYSGNASRALCVIESRKEIFQNYPPALFILAAARCCSGDDVNGIKELQKLKNMSLGSMITYSCAELADGLISAGELQLALRLLKATIESGLFSKNIIDLYTASLSQNEVMNNTGIPTTKIDMSEAQTVSN